MTTPTKTSQAAIEVANDLWECMAGFVEPTYQSYVLESIAEAIEQALTREREECACLATCFALERGPSQNFEMGGHAIAKLIRARGGAK